MEKLDQRRTSILRASVASISSADGGDRGYCGPKQGEQSLGVRRFLSDAAFVHVTFRWAAADPNSICVTAISEKRISICLGIC